MARLAIRMPKMSMTMTEGEVSSWLVKVGDTAPPEAAPDAGPQSEEPGAVSGPAPASAPRAAAKMREAG